ncbi:uncharacterized protein EHS24_004038 [Apiotrichum porosum]|uniref:Uncharacterized protein n=1 Tax=Apiotrichum porosum TaxID=105984 RepID=A0A427Y450_9TREE|nr:uncharacterized protein EHS24_004038 [Apiotrichum porosum]RSH85858.1 hypothetical protein EHS24_004038 [Apiotrichum porosum]
MVSPCFSIVSAAGSSSRHGTQHLTYCFSQLKSFTPPPVSPDISATPSASTNAEGLLVKATLAKLLRDQSHAQNHAVHASQPWRSKQKPANAHRQKRRNLVWRSLGWAVIFMCSFTLLGLNFASAVSDHHPPALRAWTYNLSFIILGVTSACGFGLVTTTMLELAVHSQPGCRRVRSALARNSAAGEAGVAQGMV